jgi:predicted RNA-binding protein YlqC (UPF0109 family)
MKDLADFLIKNITGNQKHKIEVETDQDRIEIKVDADPDSVGLLIGKEGKTIKNLRKILSIKATMMNKVVNISVNNSEKD